MATSLPVRAGVLDPLCGCLAMSGAPSLSSLQPRRLFAVKVSLRDFILFYFPLVFFLIFLIFFGFFLFFFFGGLFWAKC